MPAGAKKPIYAPYVEHVPPNTTAAIFWLCLADGPKARPRARRRTRPRTAPARPAPDGGKGELAAGTASNRLAKLDCSCQLRDLPKGLLWPLLARDAGVVARLLGKGCVM
jgi:hypothetical protein